MTVVQYLLIISECGDCEKMLQIGEYICNKCWCFGQKLWSCWRNFENANQLIVNSLSNTR